MYLESKMKKPHGLPWMGALSNAEKANNEYFKELEKLARQIDDVEGKTSFISYLSPDEFDSGYSFVEARITELKEYIVHESVIPDKYGALRSLNEIKRELAWLRDEAVLYDDEFGDIDFYDDRSSDSEYNDMDNDDFDQDEDDEDSDYEDEDFDDDYDGYNDDGYYDFDEDDDDDADDSSGRY